MEVMSPEVSITFISSCPLWRGGRMGRRLSEGRHTWGPLGLLPALGKPSFQGPQIPIFVDIVLGVLEDLHTASLSIGGGGSFKDLAVDFVDFPFELVDAVVDGLLLLYLGLLGRKPWIYAHQPLA